MTRQEIAQEFDRQSQTLLAAGYANAAGHSETEFLALLQPLRETLPHNSSSPDLQRGRLPFVVVVPHGLVSNEHAMAQTQRLHKKTVLPGRIKLYPKNIGDFHDSVDIPPASPYVLLDIDRGDGTRSLAPAAALPILESQQRSPLTISEGIAVVTQHPNFLIKNHCFSLLASRTQNDLRVPAIWICGTGQANLGWCWHGNPHTWLGSASCGQRAMIAKP